MDLLQEARNIINDVDDQMAQLFVRRMRAAEMVAQYKKEHGLPIFDAQREEAVIRNGMNRIHDETLRSYYTDFIRSTMAVSKQYQQRLIGTNGDVFVDLGANSYTITIRRGALANANAYMNLNRKVLIVTDNGVPAQYAKTVASCCASPVIVTIPQGEGSKNLRNFETLCRTMLENGFTRTDCVVAVGGGVVGDLAGFAAASFMRGIDFYNIPTTVLSQVDSSVGGKVAIDMNNIKNCVGAFHQPKAVLIDPDVLNTLPPRQIANGLAEAVKMAVTFDETLLSVFEQEDYMEHIDEIITASVRLKAEVVRQDEKESGLRRVLNFGHTIGHGIETAAGLDKLYHGECVALGMIPMCEESLRIRLIAILEKMGLPTSWEADPDAVWQAMSHDKKLSGNTITVVYAPKAGSFELRSMPITDLKETVYSFLNKKG
jgi:3-dehydroquinate synthase